MGVISPLLKTSCLIFRCTLKFLGYTFMKRMLILRVSFLYYSQTITIMKFVNTLIILTFGDSTACFPY